jgi:hypothetical protein
MCNISFHFILALINLGSGNLEWGGKGKGWERGGQFTSNLRPRWTDPVTEGGFPSTMGDKKSDVFKKKLAGFKTL